MNRDCGNWQDYLIRPASLCFSDCTTDLRPSYDNSLLCVTKGLICCITVYHMPIWKTYLGNFYIDCDTYLSMWISACLCIAYKLIGRNTLYMTCNASMWIIIVQDSDVSLAIDELRLIVKLLTMYLNEWSMSKCASSGNDKNGTFNWSGLIEPWVDETLCVTNGPSVWWLMLWNFSWYDWAELWTNMTWSNFHRFDLREPLLRVITWFAYFMEENYVHDMWLLGIIVMTMNLFD